MEESELDEESAGRPQRLPVMLFAGVDGSPVSSDKAAKDFTGASSRSFSLPFDEGVCEEPNVAGRPVEVRTGVPISEAAGVIGPFLGKLDALIVLPLEVVKAGDGARVLSDAVDIAGERSVISSWSTLSSRSQPRTAVAFR